AFDPDEGGVVSAGGVGFDISCGVRTLITGVSTQDVRKVQRELANTLYECIPAGLGSTGALRLSPRDTDKMLSGGARWALKIGYGRVEDLERIEERGAVARADPSAVSEQAKRRQRDEMGTLGSGNHYLEVQRVAEIHDAHAARALGLEVDAVVVSMHCGSRGLGHQIGTDYLREMAVAAKSAGIALPDRELACAPIRSAVGQRYLGAMRAAINCALANRQILTHLARDAFRTVLPAAKLDLLYDVSHNTCKLEEHEVDGRRRELFVHRKGATRAFGPGHPDLPAAYREAGQPVLVGGTMGTASFLLAGPKEAERPAFGSSRHRAGRKMSRTQAKNTWQGGALIRELGEKGILVKAHTKKGAAEEAPGAYKDVEEVAAAAEAAGLSKRVARFRPVAVVKG